MSAANPQVVYRRIRPDELALMWAWVEGCCVSAFGEGPGRERAKYMPLKAGLLLWKRQLSLAPDADA
jgi:hypothetical protein